MPLVDPPSGFGRPIGRDNEIRLSELKKIYRLMIKMRNHLDTDQDKEDFLTLASFFRSIRILPTKDELHLVSTYKEYFEELSKSAKGR